MAGIRFIDARPTLRLVAENGIDELDPRVKRRTNEAIQELLTAITKEGAPLIAVNSMMTVDLVADDDEILLPVEMENIIEIEVLGENTAVNFNRDIKQGHYDIVNPFTYVDPAAAMDNPLIDLGLEPDATDPTILRRRYRYPGITPNSVVRATGVKAYRPIVNDSDSLIIQNVAAIKLMIQGIEARENGLREEGQGFKDDAIKLLEGEVKRHMLDPRQTMKRKAGYLADLAKYPVGSMGWMRAQIALNLPNAMHFGKSELTRFMERAEERFLHRGAPKGSLEEFEAEVVDGVVYLPRRVESVRAVSLNGVAVDIRSIYAKYNQAGPGSCSCSSQLEDEGEEFFTVSGTYRRKYRLKGALATQFGVSTETPQAVSSSTPPVTPPGGGGTLAEGGNVNTFTINSILNIGPNARIVITATGFRIEVKEGSAWIVHINYEPGP